MNRFPVGLEEAADGAAMVHSLSIPGCAAGGATRDEALEAFQGTLAEWLLFLRARGEAVPAPGSELEIAVDEWVESDANVAAGESTVCFQAELVPLEQPELLRALHRLGDLRGRLLRELRAVRDADLDRVHVGEWTVRRVLDELARAQWWTLTRLGASPLGEVPQRTLGRLDTAMALVVQQLTELPAEARARVLEMDGEVWTPRKVLRRLLWLEWTLGGSASRALASAAPTA